MVQKRGMKTSLRGLNGMLAWAATAGLGVLLPWGPVDAMEITPLRTGNMAPLLHIHGLPVPDRARILSQHEGEASLAADLANNFAASATGDESVTFDGETYRIALEMRYGIAPGVEAGIEVPLVLHSGGFLDGFIEGFHDTFNFSSAGRDDVSRDQLLYRYDKNGSNRFRVDGSNGGIGDIRLTGGIQLYDDQSANPRRLALRGALKLPTGDSGHLRGSGSVDVALWLSASDDYSLGGWGHLTAFANAGGTVMGDGDVLGEQQRTLAATGNAGFGWSPLDRLALTVQTTWNSSLYKGSALREVDNDSLVITGGGTIGLAEKTSLDLAISEDLSVDTAPDVAFHLALRQRF